MDTNLDSLTDETRICAERLIDQAKRWGYGVAVRSTRRSCAEQEEEWRAGHGAQGCHSWHVHGRAVDLTLVPGECADYRRLGELWESWGGKWGGRWVGEKFGACGDMGHYEWHPGLTLADVCPDGPECVDAGVLVRRGAYGLAGFAIGASATLAAWWYLGRRT